MAKNANLVPRFVVGSAFIIDTGSSDGSKITATVVSSTANTVVVSGLTATLNEYATRIITVNSGTGIGQLKTVSGNTATSAGNTPITITGTWATNPPAASIIELDPAGTRTELGFLSDEAVTIKTEGIGIPECGGGSLSKAVIITAETNWLEVLSMPTFEATFKNKVCWLYFFPSGCGNTVVCKNFTIGLKEDLDLSLKGKTVAKIIGTGTALNFSDAVCIG